MSTAATDSGQIVTPQYDSTVNPMPTPLGPSLGSPGTGTVQDQGTNPGGFTGTVAPLEGTDPNFQPGGVYYNGGHPADTVAPPQAATATSSGGGGGVLSNSSITSSDLARWAVYAAIAIFAVLLMRVVIKAVR